MSKKITLAPHEQVVIDKLDEQAAQIPAEVEHSLRQARMAAIAKANSEKSKGKYFSALYLASYAVFAVGFSMTLFHYASYQEVTPIPGQMLTELSSPVPLEDQALVEDLEFLQWLAENEQVL